MEIQGTYTVLNDPDRGGLGGGGSLLDPIMYQGGGGMASHTIMSVKADSGEILALSLAFGLALMAIVALVLLFLWE